MDTITQAVLGAAVGQAGFGPRLGRRAAWWGAVGGTVPDLDVFSRVFVGEWGDLVWHRGPTHAVWFGPVVGPLIAYGLWRWYRRRTGGDPDGPGGPTALRAWVGLWVLALLTHPLLDVFTTYGTQLLSPFAATRFALDGVAIIDPLYTVPLAVALLLGRRWRATPRRAARAAAVALAVTTAYLGYGTWLNHRAEALARAQVDAPDVARVEAYPTLFQPWLRRVVVWRTGAVEVGPLSLLVPGPIPFVRREVPADGAVLALEATPEAALFRWFANDAVAPSRGRDADGHERVRLEDVRYGFFGTTDALWGIEAPVEGDRLGPVHRYRSAMPDAGRTLAAMLRLTFQGP